MNSGQVRHHRLRSRIPQANPHRFRHTFGADMARDGVSLPALQHLMGHARFAPPCSTSNSHRTTSGGNITAPSKNEAKGTRNRTNVSSLCPHRTDFRSSHPNSRLNPAAWQRVRLSPGSRRFLCYLRARFPRLRRLRQLRRDPHLLGWFRSLCEPPPPLAPATHRLLLFFVCRLLEDLAAHAEGRIRP
jgi:integrase-like protein